MLMWMWMWMRIVLLMRMCMLMQTLYHWPEQLKHEIYIRQADNQTH